MGMLHRPRPDQLANAREALLLVCLVLTVPASAAAQGVALGPGLTLVPGEGWSSVPPRAREAAVLRLRGADGRGAGRAAVTVSLWRTAGDAVAQLDRNVPAGGGQPTVSEVAGWPAVTFTRQLERERPEDDERAVKPQPYTRIVTLVAVDKTLVRFSITLGAKPGPDVLKRAHALARGLRTSKHAPPAQTGRHLRAVRAGLRARAARLSALPRSARRRELTRLAWDRVRVGLQPSTPTGAGAGRELEIAVSPDGRDIVIVSNNRWTFTSNNGGTTFGQAVAYPTPAVVPPGGTGFGRRSDLSVARAPSGRFYLSFLGRENFPLDRNQNTVSVAVSEPGDRGSNFSFLSHVVRCDDEAPHENDDLFTTDQPHIAVDPRVRPGQDQVYVVWRKNMPDPESDDATCHVPKVGFDIMLSCSADGGQNWTTRQIDGEDMYPRVTVGQDGMVYVVWEDDRRNANIFLSKFSSCEDGLQPQVGLDGLSVTAFAGVPRVPGLDRNNSGNILASPTVAVDPAHPQHVFIAYADRTAEGNDDIVVLGSTDGGETWPLRTTANATNRPGRRFMPWLCAAPEQLFVSWYDRSDATAAAPDLTRYSVALVEPKIGGVVEDHLSRVTGTSVSAMPDPQCRLWPEAPRNMDDARLCPGPQRAGICCRNLDAQGRCTTPGGVPDGSSHNQCDYPGPDGATVFPCPSGETCALGDGQPKYGDYTGNACLAGSAFVTWAAATNPADGAPLAASNIFFARVDVTLTAFLDLCADGRCGFISSGNVGELLLNCPDRGCRIVAYVPEICQSVLNCPGCGPGGRCPQEFTFQVAGLDAGWGIRLADEKGQPVPGVMRRNGTTLAITLRPEKSRTINGSVGRYVLILERNRQGKRQVPARLRVTASTP